METRISRFADKTIEAAVLVAVLAVPLLFNPYSARVFEAEKAGLLRTLALIILAAWTTRVLGTHSPDSHRSQGPRRRFMSALQVSSLREQPVMVAALLLGLVVILAGLTSITPRLSLWGSYQRSQGIITTLSYVVLFFAALMILHRAGARRRLVSTMLVASGPIALFATLQYAGIELVPLSSVDPSRVYATLSNPIFLGAYLVMVIPLTLAQIVRYFTNSAGVQPLGLMAYGVLLALQLAAALFTRSRGPLMGIGGGVVLFAFLLALRSRRRRLAAGLIGITLLGLVLLITFNLPNTPLTSLQGVPVIGRFGQALEGGSGRVRVLIWQSVVDRFNGEPERLALGYGPESTHAALLATFQPELRRLEPERLPDRAHNVFLEALVTSGVAGTLTLVFLFAAVFYTGMRELGWVSTSRDRNQWLILTVAGLVLGVLSMRVAAGGWTLAGLGISLGLLAGLGVFLIVQLWRSGRLDGHALTDRSIIIAAILAIMAGHLLEITVGIRVTATETLFWVLAGLLVALSTAREETVARNTAPSADAGDGITLVWDPETAGYGVLSGLMLSTLAFGIFLLAGTGVSTSLAGRWILLAGAWLLTGALWLAAPDAEKRPGTSWIHPVVSLAWFGVFLAVRSLVQVAGGDALTVLNLYFVWLLLSLVVVAALLPRRKKEKLASLSWPALASPLLAVLTLALVVWLVIKPLQADIYLEAADANAEAGQWSQALALYQQAATEAPGVDVYQQHLGEALVTAAGLIQDPNQRDSLFQAAEQAFQRAVTLNPAEETHLFNLAHMYLLWGQATSDPGRQNILLSQAAELYQQAASRTPHDPRILDEWGLALQAQGNSDAALAKYRQALDVDPQDAQAYFYMGNLYLRSGKADQALQMYQQVIELEPNRAEAYRALADLYRDEGQLQQAISAQQQAAQLQPTDYAIHQNLAVLYRDVGQIQSAVAEARLALNYAPPERRDALQSFIDSLLASGTP